MKTALCQTSACCLEIIGNKQSSFLVDASQRVWLSSKPRFPYSIRLERKGMWSCKCFLQRPFVRIRFPNKNSSKDPHDYLITRNMETTTVREVIDSRRICCLGPNSLGAESVVRGHSPQALNKQRYGATTSDRFPYRDFRPVTPPWSLTLSRVGTGFVTTQNVNRHGDYVCSFPNPWRRQDGRLNEPLRLVCIDGIFSSLSNAT